MRISIRVAVFLAGACLIAGVAARGQQAPGPEGHGAGSIDVAVVFNPLIANVVGDGDNGFWMPGGSAQIQVRLWRGLGVVGDVAGMHTSDANGPRVGLDLITTTFGPRYSWTPAHRRYEFFGQFLAGGANGRNSIFPSSSGVSDSANSLALYLGGGSNVQINHRLTLRLFEADWLRTQMPNSTTDVQNNLRLGAGIVFRVR